MQHAKGYPPGALWIEATRASETAQNDVADLLCEGGIHLEDIKHVIIRYDVFACFQLYQLLTRWEFGSHLHWDHIGDPALFQSANIILGADAKSALATDVYPANPLGTILQFPADSKITFVNFDPADTPGRILSPFMSFDRALDFFGDGTLYLVDAPGHYKGHIAALVRVAPGTFVFLGADTCHNRQCYTPGTRLASETPHQDVVRARETIKKLTAMNAKMIQVVTVLAHEAEVLEEGMPLFPGDIKEWAIERVAKRMSMRAQALS
jgi:glyoxylase-like metal-dependent hydrolase (beta-lactamase superfamily II)